MWIRIFSLLITILLSADLLAGPDPYFIENKNQWDQSIQFISRVPGGFMQLRKGSFGYRLMDQEKMQNLHERAHHGDAEISEEELSIREHYVQAVFENANTTTMPIPFGKRSEYHNYFIGADSAKWSSRVHLYDGVLFPNYYPGIDLKVYTQGGTIKYDWLISAGADPQQIIVRYDGADQVALENGDLVIHTTVGDIIEQAPVAYQMIDGIRVEVKTKFQLCDGKMSFIFPTGYDSCFPLVIDPLLIFSTYSGSTADNWGSTATPGERGRLYSGGTTNLVSGGEFPATPGAYQTTYSGGAFDVTILKYDSSGRTLLYASFLGGTGVESVHSLVMNSANELYILGTTSSNNFPTTEGAFDRTFNGGDNLNVIGIPYFTGSDLFVAKLSSDGARLLSSTYLGGSQNDGLSPRNQNSLIKNYGDELRGDIIVAPDGSVVISTVTSSVNFPMLNSIDNTYNGGLTDALVLKINSSLSNLVWSTYLGGSAADASHTVQIDRLGNLYVAGGTASANFPVSIGSYRTSFSGDVDGWIARIQGDGSTLLASTYTGTTAFDQVYFVDLDRNDNVFVYGQTSGQMPVTSGAYRNPNSGQFLQKFNPALSTLMVATVFGSGRGIPDISPTAFLVNDCNNIYLTGWGGNINRNYGYWSSDTRGMPVTNDAFQRTTVGSDFYFIVLSIDATQLLYATYMGGNQSAVHVDGGTSRFDKGGVVYHAVCAGCQFGASDFPTTPGAWSRTNRSRNCNNAAFKFDLSSLRARIQTNAVDLKSPGISGVCLGEDIVFENKSTGGQTFTWWFGDGQSVVKTNTENIVYRYTKPGKYTVKLRAVDAGTCIGKDSTVAVVNVWTVDISVGPDQTMCYDAGVKLVAAGGISYAWTEKDGSFTSNQSSPIVNPTKDATYLVTVRDANGCTLNEEVNVRVVPGIDLQFDYQKVYDCFSRPSLNVVNKTETDEYTFFDFGDGTTSDLIEDQHSYTQDGTYRVKLVGAREACVYEKAVDVSVVDLRVPNVITPGTVGSNDTFRIGYGSTASSRPPYRTRVRIFNRWGKKVFESDDYQDDWAGEDVAGIYFYEVELEGETSCKGWVQVIK